MDTGRVIRTRLASTRPWLECCTDMVVIMLPNGDTIGTGRPSLDMMWQKLVPLMFVSRLKETVPLFVGGRRWIEYWNDTVGGGERSWLRGLRTTVWSLSASSKGSAMLVSSSSSVSLSLSSWEAGLDWMVLFSVLVCSSSFSSSFSSSSSSFFSSTVSSDTSSVLVSSLSSD